MIVYIILIILLYYNEVYPLFENVPKNVFTSITVSCNIRFKICAEIQKWALQKVALKYAPLHLYYIVINV